MTGIRTCRASGTKHFGPEATNVATIGNVTEEAIKKYITEQSEESRKEDSEGAAF